MCHVSALSRGLHTVRLPGGVKQRVMATFCHISTRSLGPRKAKAVVTLCQNWTLRLARRTCFFLAARYLKSPGIPARGDDLPLPYIYQGNAEDSPSWRTICPELFFMEDEDNTNAATDLHGHVSTRCFRSCAAIAASPVRHAACRYDFRRNVRSHS